MLNSREPKSESIKNHMHVHKLILTWHFYKHGTSNKKIKVSFQ